MFFFFLSQVVHFLSVTRKKTEPKERVRKRPGLGGRVSDFPKHSMNSIRDSILFQKILHTLKTSSCGMFSRSYATRRHGARSAVIGFVAWLVQECFRGVPRRQAFSVVGVKKTWRTLSVSEGQRLESHTKTLMERASSRNQLSPLPKIGEGFGEWSEAPSYEEGVGVDGGPQGSALQKKVR